MGRFRTSAATWTVLAIRRSEREGITSQVRLGAAGKGDLSRSVNALQRAARVRYNTFGSSFSALRFVAKDLPASLSRAAAEHAQASDR
jgi:hypothetical protein